ncbi:hypothetical protein [Leptothoe spongobia]|uniref:Uncharacterized protein n=1 Tax=Leptothoe spongobia TAU-MAC 1115 TaxID=1967444 RepID=A0A947DCV3_9CYAN|nr:hypothetical protein [Leptothoe spongobia]MBT9314612.1 hypothetical protein [Leptothoe spongobia TAU-MAC 1115]
MSSQQFPITSLQTLRRSLKQQLVLPECEHTPSATAADNMPEPDSLASLSNLFRKGGITHTEGSTPNANGRWFISTVDASAVFKHLPGISLKPNYCLVTYLYRIRRSNINHGGAVTWAMVNQLSTTSHLEAALAKAGDHSTPPYPEGALLNYMTAVTGNLTSGSFLIASVLQRELQEFGRCGKFHRWQHHRLIGNVPKQKQWQWRMEPPRNLTPKVHNLPNGKMAVEFYTCRTIPPIGIFRHVDRYTANSYVAKASNQAIASAVE